MAWLENLHHPEYYIKTFLKWAFLSVIVGSTGGLLGAAFHHVLHFVTHIRAQNNWLIFLLPVGGLLTVAVYQLMGVRRNRGTNLHHFLSQSSLKEQFLQFHFQKYPQSL